MGRDVTLGNDIYGILRELAREEGKDAKALLSELIIAEDKRRHVKSEPFKKDVRMRCASAGCKENEKTEYPYSDMDI